mgnify:CR=1 FL=1
MTEVHLVLVPLFQGFFHWNLARAKCIANLIVALIKVRTVNLVQLAIALPGTTQDHSKYRRLQRLFREVKIDFSTLAFFISTRPGINLRL